MPSQGTTRQRGYGHRHRSLREQWKPKVEAGKVKCWRCDKPIRPGDKWDLGHSDDRSHYEGPEHIQCNRATAARRPKTDASRAW